jgi:hypothetical protein
LAVAKSYCLIHFIPVLLDSSAITIAFAVIVVERAPVASPEVDFKYFRTKCLRVLLLAVTDPKQLMEFS